MKKLGFPLSFLFLAALLAVGSGLFLSGVGCSSNSSASGPTTIVETAPTATPVCASPSAQGVTVQEPDSAYLLGGIMAALSVTFTTGETALSISMDVGSQPATQARFAIYTDSGSNSPADLIVQTGPVFLTANAWNSFALPAPVYLAAGKYWIVDLFSGESYVWISATGGDYIGASYPWGQMPTAFPTGGSTDTNLISEYISTCP